MKRIFLALALICGLVSPVASGSLTLLGVGSASGGGGGPVPAADLNFASNTSSGCSTFASCLTNTNSTGGYVTNSGGTITSVAANTLRIGTGTGLLIEESRTNQLLQSGALQTTPWSAGGIVVGAPTVTANAAVAPDGTTTAAQIAYPAVSGTGADSTVSQGSVDTTNCGLGGNSNCDYSVYIKGTVGGETIYISDTVDGVHYASAPCVATTSWQRCSFSSPPPSFYGGGHFYQIGIDLRDSAQSPQSAQTVFLWGAELESGAFPTSYIATTTATVTRSADSIAVSGTLATTLAAATGTIVANTNSSQPSLPASILDANGTILLGKTSGNLGTTAVGATLSTGNTGTWTGANDLGLAWNASGGAIQLNGGSIATDATARTPSATFHVGSTSGSSAFFDGYITRLTAYTSKLASPQ